MKGFRDLSLRSKLNLLVMGTSMTALLVACVALGVYEVVDFRKRMAQDLGVAAEGIAINVKPALDFGDAQSAENILASLRARENAMAAVVYDRDGQPLARYVREDLQGFTPPRPGRTGSSSPRTA